MKYYTNTFDGSAVINPALKINFLNNLPRHPQREIMDLPCKPIYFIKYIYSPDEGRIIRYDSEGKRLKWYDRLKRMFVSYRRWGGLIK